jgi:hypothetical protein
LDADESPWDFSRIADAYAAISAETIEFHVKEIRVNQFDKESGGIGFDHKQRRLEFLIKTRLASR